MHVVAASQAAALLLLFVVLPFIVAGGVIAFISWRSEGGPPPVRTSEILDTGAPGEADVLAIKQLGGFADPRPMARFSLRIRVAGDAEPFVLDVTQSLPRNAVRALRPGDVVEVRVTEDRTHAAIVLSDAPADPG